MIRKLRSSLPGHVRVTFELPSCIWADRIFVVGDFNDWDARATPLRQNRNGVWQAGVDLPLGKRFEFRYWIDGQWSTDYHADGSTSNIYGTENSVVEATLSEDETLVDSTQASLIHEERMVRAKDAGQIPKLSHRHRHAA